MKTTTLATVAVIAALGLAPVGLAQTLPAVEGGGMLIDEMSGPSDPANCFYPVGPFLFAWNYNQLPACGANPVPANYVSNPANLQGDVAVDRTLDRTYVTDGGALGAYDRFGNIQDNYTLAGTGLGGLVTGMGWDGTNQQLWITDGFDYLTIVPNVPCPGWVFGTVAAVTAKPLDVPGKLTDISYDPFTNTLWACDDLGNVAQFNSGAVNSIQVVNVGGAIPGCGIGLNLIAPLTGLAFDTTLNGADTLMITDGNAVARMVFPGGGAAPIAAAASFAFPYSCWTVSPAPIQSGLGFTAHGVPYGLGSLTPPGMSIDGNTVVSGTPFNIEWNGTVTGSLYLLVSFTGVPACGATAKGAPLLANPDLVIPFGPVAGPASFAANVGGQPVGLATHLQWFVQTTTGWESSNGVTLTTAAP